MECPMECPMSTQGRPVWTAQASKSWQAMWQTMVSAAIDVAAMAKVLVNAALETNKGL